MVLVVWKRLLVDLTMASNSYVHRYLCKNDRSKAAVLMFLFVVAFCAFSIDLQSLLSMFSNLTTYLEEERAGLFAIYSFFVWLCASGLPLDTRGWLPSLTVAFPGLLVTILMILIIDTHIFAVLGNFQVSGLSGVKPVIISCDCLVNKRK